MDIYEQRQKAKLERDAYRIAAGKKLHGMVHLSGEQTNTLLVNTRPEDLHVPEHANVMPLPDGAFVDCVIWIPKEHL